MNNVQPRSASRTPSIRRRPSAGGYGLFYTLSRATVFGHTGGGFNVNSTPTFTLDSNATRYATLANPYPTACCCRRAAQGDARSSAWAPAPSCPATTATPNTWNMSVQREVGWSSVLEANYTGSRGTHLFLPITTLTRCLRSTGRWGARR